MPVSKCRYNASEGCWQRFEELAAYGYSRFDPAFHHQTVVDAYGAQHSGKITPTIGATYSLIGLYLTLEHGFNGKEVQKAHMVLAKHRRDWPRLDSPERPGTLTVQDVLQAEPGEHRDSIVTAWALSVWHAWDKDQEWVREVSKKLLKI